MTPACPVAIAAGQTAPPSPTASPAGGGDEVIVTDYEAGHWLYENAATGVRIEIVRKEDQEQRILWYEADLQCNERYPLQFLTANEERPGKGFAYAESIVREHRAVFGINDDQFGHRMYNRKTVGVIIRNGLLISEKTKPNGNLSWPTLDTAAFLPDGRMLVSQSREYTGEEYLQMGAGTVLSFGPWLVKNGELNPLCAKHFKTREPRTAIGIVEPYHYVAISVEGRIEQSRGVGMQWLAERMQTLHAQNAINLDGGKTTAMLFMGKTLKINNPKGEFVKNRSVSGMITLGTSEAVALPENVKE